MTSMIPDTMRNGLYCFFCGDSRSVKYLKPINLNKEGRLVTVCCCNKCEFKVDDYECWG